MAVPVCDPQCYSDSCPLTFIMTSYRFCVVSVLLFMVYLVQSAKIWGGIRDNVYDAPNDAEFSETINGYNTKSIRFLTLYRLVKPGNVPALTISNFKSLRRLEIMNISLQNVPTFEETSIESIVITGNKIKRLPANAFDGPRPRHFNLTDNGIESIADSAINMGAGFVVLSCNKLTSFSQAWFQDPGSMTAMILVGNQIEHIQHQAFSLMTSLQTLELSNNRISRIDSEAFIARIRHLFLDFNEIGQLTADMFATRDKTMWSLYIHHNRLSYLSEELFVKLKLDKVIIDGNPWQCQCLRHIERWLREMNTTRVYLTYRRDDPACVVPGSFEDICIHAVDKKLEQLYVNGLPPAPDCAKPCSRCPSGDYSPSIFAFQYTPAT